MTVVAAIEAVAIVVIVLLFLRHVTLLEQRTARERSELADRIQAPDRLPRPVVASVDAPAREPDGWADVGAVKVTKDWLEADD